MNWKNVVLVVMLAVSFSGAILSLTGGSKLGWTLAAISGPLCGWATSEAFPVSKRYK